MGVCENIHEPILIQIWDSKLTLRISKQNQVVNNHNSCVLWMDKAPIHNSVDDIIEVLVILQLLKKIQRPPSAFEMPIAPHEWGVLVWRYQKGKISNVGFMVWNKSTKYVQQLDTHFTIQFSSLFHVVMLLLAWGFSSWIVSSQSKSSFAWRKAMRRRVQHSVNRPQNHNLRIVLAERRKIKSLNLKLKC